MKYILIAASLLLVFAAPMGIATHEDSDCEIGPVPGETVVVPLGETGATGDIYLNDRPGPGERFGTGLVTGGGTWIYQESNDIDGLQTDSGGADTTSSQEICGHTPDTLIF